MLIAFLSDSIMDLYNIDSLRMNYVKSQWYTFIKNTISKTKMK